MKTLSKNWWFLLIKGLLFILFGVLVTFYPKEMLSKMMFLLGLVILLGGVIILGLSLMNKKDNKTWQGLMAFGVVDMVLGLFLMIFTTLAIKLLIVLIGIWAILVGIYQFYYYFKLPREARQRSLSPYIGLVAFILGLIMLFAPSGTSVFFTVLIGILSMALGAMLVAIAFRWRKQAK